MSAPSTEVSVLLRAWSGGDVGARDRLFPVIYRELRRVAAACLRQATIVVMASILLADAGTARAQDSTTGAVRGQVRDRSTGDAVVGATVVASGPALQGTQATISDELGHYTVASLPPGTYQIVVHHGGAQFSRTNVLIRLGKVAKVNIGIDTQAGAGETIVIEGRAPLIDQQSTKIGSTITQDFTQNVPTGRTFGEVLGAAPGSQDDFYGTSVGGSTSVENTYIVEGINTTDPGFGLLTTNLPNEFVQETEVITGGYNAEYGRSTGGVINVITKSGSNEFHGSVFGYWAPGALVAEERATPRAGTSIDRENNLANSFEIGAEVGGPIIEDRLWFHVGINPSFRREDVSRIIKTQVDEDGDGAPDLDENGFAIQREVDRTALDEKQATYYYSAKLTAAVTPDHQGSLVVMGSPKKWEGYFDDPYVNGARSALAYEQDRRIFDASAKWTSKFFDSRTQFDAVIGFHSDSYDEGPRLDGGDRSQVLYSSERPITDFAAQEAQDYGGVPTECDDARDDDPYPMITNCPVPFYLMGGIGGEWDSDATRLSGLLAVTQRVQALGHHVFKAGVDIEEQGYVDSHHLGDGAYYHFYDAEGIWLVTRFNTPDPDGTIPCGVDYDGDGETEARCRAIGPGEQFSADTTTRNLGAYVQDSWSILPNLTLNAGLRWEQQTLYVAEAIQGQVSPTTGGRIPDVAFELEHMLAPRIGAIYDWTQEGRSKLFGHYGRFYESIPMAINALAYGGSVTNVNVLARDACELDDPIGTCDEVNGSLGSFNIGGGETMVAPGLGAQYMEEMVVGGEYEIVADLKIGASYIRRDLGRVIEDVSTDGGDTYIIANPGDVDEESVAELREQAMKASEADAAFLNYQADVFEGVGIFDKPKRTYSAVQITAERRFTESFFLTASYTYSELRGNYPGLFSHETKQLAPNITSLYDLPESMANRYGNLGADRPHLVKLDGFYRLPVERVGFFTFGASVRAQSGLPITTLGSHPRYGFEESYLLERGSGGRMGLTTRFDSHVAYARRLTDGIRIEIFVDIFNMFNQQPETEVDESYTFESVNPIVGGDEQDLAHAKVLGSGRGPSVNRNHGNTVSRQAPLSARFGLRLIF